MPQPAPHQHLVLHHPSAIWCKHPRFLPPKEVETGHRACRGLIDAQRGLEMLLPPEATSSSWEGFSHQPTPAPTLQSVPRPPALALSRAKLVPVVPCPGIQGHCTAQLVPGHVPADSTVLMDTHGSKPAWQHWWQPHGRKLPLSVSQCPSCPSWTPVPCLSLGQPGRDSDLSPEDTAQPSTWSQL